VRQETEIREPEDALIARVRRGDTSAFSALVSSHEDRAIGLAYSFLGNWEDAREAAQNAFVKAYRDFQRFRGESHFTTWFHRILVNECRDFLRKKKVRRNLAVNLTGDGDNEDVREAPELRIPGRENPGRDAADRELGEAIRSHAAQLPEQQHAVFIMRYMEDMSLEEIASSLRLTTGAVKAHLWQANRKMKEKLSKYRQEGTV